MAKRYLAKLYSKYFLIILSALVLFFVGLDFLQAFKKLPDSANLQLLYIFYRFLHGIDILYPISLVFAMIGLKVMLIRSNELVALYALGYSKRAILAPMFLTSLVLTFIYFFLHLTSFTYANEYADNIRKYNSLQSATKELYFKYNSSYVYFDKLLPLAQEAFDIRIFETKGRNLQKIVTAKRAKFTQDHWHLFGAKIVQNFGDHIEVRRSDLNTLYGYKPKILDSVYEGKSNISLLDAIYALELFYKQKIDTQKLKAVVYYNLFYPFFAPLLMIIIFYFVPITARIASLNLFSFGAIVFTLFSWGVLYTLAKMAFNGALKPEAAILIPIGILFIVSFYFYKKF
ncbi:LptF/LptG family permease [Nitratiruptor sp. YY09-18]|uniref:LptF/LptG family permease n=1 Tax=Nitratiruptor sp. YY09-18 TaxID=2724901 RepID=UPI0019152FA8|nr:LptF/LptG family permease [Nitratiruptor sp. YY09-18]BCD67540.1 lipopolysaccharide export system permease protein [Nitratiruptor sp. YY09-18]